MEIERSRSLFQLIEDEGLLPTPEADIKRRNVINKLNQIVMEWSKRVAYQHRLPQSYISATSATILIYGSSDLGVHSDGSDLDALCVGPCFASLEEDFFVLLRNMLATRPEVSEIISVKNAKVPLMRLNFDGITIDLPYAKLDTVFVLENVGIRDPFFLTNIDEISWTSLSGVRVNKRILSLVPNFKVYQLLLHSVKLWAKRRGIYASLVGYFGGVHLAVLTALVCRRKVGVSLSTMVSIFFQTFGLWPWPTPVILEDVVNPLQPIRFRMRRYTMPIQLPCTLPDSPNEYCFCGTTRSTFNRILCEFQRGHYLTKDLLVHDFDWRVLFEPFPYVNNYERFLKIRLSSTKQNELREWVGWVKSRLRHLHFRLEKLMELCDPNLTEYTDSHFAEPHVVLYWGLSQHIDVGVASIEQDFAKKICTEYLGPVGRLDLTVVKACEFPKTRSKECFGGSLQ